MEELFCKFCSAVGLGRRRGEGYDSVGVRDATIAGDGTCNP